MSSNQEIPLYETEKLHDHEVRLKLIEQRCLNHGDNYVEIKGALKNIQESIVNLKVENASNTGLRALLFGSGGGGLVVGLAKALAYFTGKANLG